MDISSTHLLGFVIIIPEGLLRLTTHFCPVVCRVQHVQLLSASVNHKTLSQEHNLITATCKVGCRVDRNCHCSLTESLQSRKCSLLSHIRSFSLLFIYRDSFLFSNLCHCLYVTVLWMVPDVQTDPWFAYLVQTP